MCKSCSSAAAIQPFSHIRLSAPGFDHLHTVKKENDTPLKRSVLNTVFHVDQAFQQIAVSISLLSALIFLHKEKAVFRPPNIFSIANILWSCQLFFVYSPRKSVFCTSTFCLFCIVLRIEKSINLC